MIFARAPLRLPLGGGGTDLPSYYRHHEGFVLSAAIARHVGVMASEAVGDRYRLRHLETEDVARPDDIRHPILRHAVARHGPGRPVEIAVASDVPAGSGLGSSGSLTVAALAALAALQGRVLTPAGLAEAACEVELDLVGSPAGKQDQYTAAHGGIRSYTFHRDGTVTVEPLDLSPEAEGELADGLMLFFTGTTRAAARVLADQDRRSRAGEAAVLDGLHRTKSIGLEIRDLLAAGDVKGFAGLMHEHWLVKRSRSAGITDPRTDRLYGVARDAGAVGGKLVGAGGGGFLLVWSPVPADTRAALAAEGLQELAFGFDRAGATAGPCPPAP